MKVVIGVDGGGTNTRACSYVTESDKPGTLGALSGTGDTGPCNIAFMPLGDAVSNVAAAIKRACPGGAEIGSICAAVAGYSFQTRRAQFSAELGALFPNARIGVVPDFAAAFRGALPDGKGILVVAGTGSVAYGSDGEGRSHRAGGYGYLIDDAGAGHGVGRAALAAALRSIDGTGPPTTLSRRIAEQVGADGWDSLIEGVYSGSIDRVTIAGFASLAASAASEDEDEVALRILMHAGGALARLAEAVFVTIRSEDIHEPALIARTGSLWKAGPNLTDVFERSVLRFAPGAVFVPAQHQPVTGAALLALHL